VKDRKMLLIRADADAQIGTGHVMRCLALAEAWLDNGGDVSFVSACEVPELEVRLKNEGIQILHIRQKAGTLSDAEETARIAQVCGAKWIVVDGYHFGADYQKTIKDTGLSLLFIDDYGHADHYYADIVLNQNIYADMSFYKKYEPYTRFLLGTKYVLLRREFLKWSGWHREIPEVAHKILVTLGGSDPDNITQKIIEVLKSVNPHEIEVNVVIGGANPHSDRIYETVKDLSNYTLIKNSDNMAELMAWADVAISAGGSTCWELAFLSTPFVTIFIANNQKPVVLGLSAKNSAVNMGDGHAIRKKEISDTLKKIIKSTEMRSNLSINSKSLVDGEGVSRVIMNINSDPIRLRPIKQSDCGTLWNWVNELTVRRSAFNSEYIPINEHKLWFSQKISDPNCFFLIGLDRCDNPIGQIRFDITGNNAIVDISIDKNERKKGLAKILINKGLNELQKKYNISVIKAYIKKENRDSVKAFMACNFEFTDTEKINNSETILLSRKIL